MIDQEQSMSIEKFNEFLVHLCAQLGKRMHQRHLMTDGQINDVLKVLEEMLPGFEVKWEAENPPITKPPSGVN